MAISDELAEIYAGSSQDRYIETLEVAHPSFTKTFLLHNDATSASRFFALAAGGAPEEFEAIPFQVNLPASDSGFLQDLQIAIANAGDIMMSELEEAGKNPHQQIEITYRVYLDTNNAEPQNDPPLKLTATQINADLDVVTATASRFDVLNRSFPRTRYTLNEFPGLDR